MTHTTEFVHPTDRCRRSSHPYTLVGDPGSRRGDVGALGGDVEGAYSSATAPPCQGGLG